MEIQVINRSREAESPDLMARLNPPGGGLPIVHAEAYAAEGLQGILEVLAARGEREIMVLDCSRAHVQAVLEWSSCHDEGQFEDLEIYLVRRA